MKTILLPVLSVFLLFSACGIFRSEPISNHISEYVRQNCKENESCVVKLSDATDFSWDIVYVFPQGSSDAGISKITGNDYSSSFSLFYSTKWIFLKDKRIVRTEAHIIYNIEKPVHNGSVILKDENQTDMYAVFRPYSICEVKTNKADDQIYYSLKCLNCQQAE